MIDYYLKADTEEELMTALEKAAVEGSVDIIGAVYDGLGFALDGFHANLRAVNELTEEQNKVLSSLILDVPLTPYRVWM